MTAPAAYATDELRLLARLSGTALPPSLGSTWLEGDEAVAEVVAARVLLARGVVSLGGANSLRVTAAVDQLFEPLRLATTILEIECRISGSGPRREIAAWSGYGSVHLVEREPDVWQLAPRDARPELADLLPSSAAPLRVGFTVDTATFDRARLHHQAGEPAIARDLLGQAGVETGAGQAWLAALEGVRAEVIVRAAEKLGDDHYALGELWWLDCGEAGLWRLTHERAPESEQPPAVTAQTAGLDELRGAIAEWEVPV